MQNKKFSACLLLEGKQQRGSMTPACFSHLEPHPQRQHHLAYPPNPLSLSLLYENKNETNLYPRSVSFPIKFHSPTPGNSF